MEKLLEQKQLGMSFVMCWKALLWYMGLVVCLESYVPGVSLLS